MSGGHTSEGLGIRFRCCTRCGSVSRADQCRLDRLSATLVPDIYVEEGDKDKDADRLFVDGDGDYGEETCED